MSKGLNEERGWRVVVLVGFTHLAEEGSHAGLDEWIRRERRLIAL